MIPKNKTPKLKMLVYANPLQSKEPMLKKA
jgi:hypothetical protein